MEILSVLDRSLVQESALSWEQKQYLKRMTLQVCLIGKDNFVLASDTRGVYLGLGEITQHYTTEKIYLNERVCTAWCSSGHHMARVLCQCIEELLVVVDTCVPWAPDQLNKCLREAVQNAQASSSREEQENGGGSVLLVTWMNGEAKGYLFKVGWLPTAEKWGITYKPIEFTDKQVSGATGNAAIFFPERHYNKALQESELIRLAAHTVLMGHQLDPGPIDGLEVAVCRAGTLRRLTHDELESLRSFSVALDDLLSKQFAEAPDVIG